MGILSSKPKAAQGPSITDTDKAVLSLKAQRKKLADQQKLLELRIDRHNEIARELVREKQQSKALLVLKKKKLVQKQLDQLATLQFSTESMINDVEMCKEQNRVFTVLKQGNEAMKTMQKEVTVEDVQKLMEDTAEAKAYQDEINAALNESLSPGDSEAVTSELEQLEAEAMQAEMAAMPKAPAVPEGYQVQVQAPAVPTHQAQSKQEQEEEQEGELEPAPRQALLAS